MLRSKVLYKRVKRKLPARRIAPFTVLATITGVIATTNANDALSAAGSTTILGTLARTNANDTSAATGTTTVTGSLAKTNADDTLAASGSAGAVTGTLAATNANDTAAADGTTTVTGSLAKANADDALAASGISGSPTGTLATTNADDAATTQGTTTVIGSASATNTNDAVAASGVSGVHAQSGGGAVIVDLPKKRKKSRKKRIDEAIEAIERTIPQELTDEQVKGMEAVYGAQMLARVEPEAMPPEAQEVVEEYAESIIEPFEVPPSVFAEPEPVAIDPHQPAEAEEPGEPEDDIALIMAIIEAIG